MPTGWELFVLRNTEFADVKKDADVARVIASRYGLKDNGVRGSLSKANTIENHVKLSKLLSSPDIEDPSVKQQKSIIQQSWNDFNSYQSELDNKDRLSVGVFISDKHNPDCRWDAWKLFLDIINDMPHVDYISFQNDWSDLKSWALKFSDERRSKEKIWDDDMAYLDRLEQSDIRAMQRAAPNAKFLAVMGNHCKRYYDYLRHHVPQASEYNIGNRMQWLYDMGVLQFSRGYHMNWIKLSESLVWLHGFRASQLATTNARNTISKFVKEGIASNVVFGHTHRPSVTEGHSIGYNGVVAINSPCMCHNDNIEYVKLGFEGNWRLGFTVCYFKPSSRVFKYDLIMFDEIGDELVAEYRGKYYSVKLENKDGQQQP